MSVTAVEQKHLFINNQWRPSSAGKTMDVINPATEEVCATVASADADDLNAAVEAARAALNGSAVPSSPPSSGSARPNRLPSRNRPRRSRVQWRAAAPPAAHAGRQ